MKYTHLPHVNIDGYYQFITFRTFDSVDEYVKKISSTNQPNQTKQQQIDDYLDSSTNGAYLNGKILEFLYEFLKSKDGVLCELVAFAIMNNHVHLLIKPLESLSKIVQSIKGGSAKIINEMIGKSGKFWADDYYDKVVRDEKHFVVVYEYIKNNPLKIGEAEASLPMKKSEAEASLPRNDESNMGTDTLVSATSKRFYGKYE